jgi:hypothetical protein
LLKISEAIDLSLQDLHFGMEAFGAVVSGEAPHGGDFVSPGAQGIAHWAS